MYSLADLEAAKTERATLEDRWINYNGNNPNKYSSERKAVQAKVKEIELHLKTIGTIPYSDQELLERELNSIFPSARNKDIVDFQGDRYRCRIYPAEKSRSGSVTHWGKSWDALP